MIPVPTAPIVVEPDTFTFCKNVAFVFVLMLSVLATPIKFAPLSAGNAPVKLLAASEPLNEVAVTTPV